MTKWYMRAAAPLNLIELCNLIMSELMNIQRQSNERLLWYRVRVNRCSLTTVIKEGNLLSAEDE